MLRPTIEVTYGDGRVEVGELISFSRPDLTPVPIDAREITFQTSLDPPMIRTLQLEWLWNEGGKATIRAPEGTLDLTEPQGRG